MFKIDPMVKNYFDLYINNFCYCKNKLGISAAFHNIHFFYCCVCNLKAVHCWASVSSARVPLTTAKEAPPSER